MANRSLFEYLDAEDSIRDSARIFSKRSGGIGESFGDGVILCSRLKLYEEAVALSRYIKRILGDEGRSVFLVDGGMYDTATVTIACSILGCSLTLSAEPPKREMTCDLLIARELSDNVRVIGKDFLSFGEICAAILGELSAEVEEDGGDSADGFSIGFVRQSDGKVERYSEQMAIRTAHRYAKAEGILPFDTCLSTLHPCSREGFFGGLLAPMLCAKRWFYCKDSDNVFEEMKLCAPTKLICLPSLADKLSSEMERLKSSPSLWQRGRGVHPVRIRWDKLFPRTRAALRRLKMTYVHYSFGGRLSSVATLGGISVEREESLARFGVLTSSALGIENCALAGFRRFGDREGFWRLPSGLFSDMCDVSSGGFGRVTFFGDGLSVGETNGHSFKAGEFRSEYKMPPLLVSDILGFSTQKGVFYAKKQTFS